MTVRLLVACDGTRADRPTMALGRCRAYLPTRAATVFAARDEALAAGWHCDLAGRDLCPDCARGAS